MHTRQPDPKQNVQTLFKRHFDYMPAHVVKAPSRLELLGNHTDYNEGLVMSLAQLTGRPILPFSYHLNWKIRPKSWDRFQIPLPFARCEMIVEKPIRVPRDISDAEREQLRQQLEQVLKAISRD